jgi:DNA-binding CsgD family transcriptional regulator/predicted SnoaL-like aldol condensation-catalyzing enzyme
VTEIEARNREVVLRWFEEIWNQRRPAAVEELSVPDVTGHLEGLPPADREGIREWAGALQAGLPDMHVEIFSAVPRGDWVTVEWRFTGTHDGVLLGIPATGRRIEQYGMTKMRVGESGLILEGRDYWNLGAFLDRLARPSVEDLVSRHGLTPRQAEVALLLADGLSAKRIAHSMGIAVNTARRHSQAVLRRLRVHNRSDVAAAIGKVDVPVSRPKLEP